MSKKSKKKFKLLFFIFDIIKSIFLIRRFFAKHPRLGKEVSFRLKKNPRPGPLSFLKKLLIPNEENNHTPASLRPKALTSYALIIIGLKLLLASYFFVSFPTVLSAYTFIETEILSLINESRQEAQVQTLNIHPELERAAQAKAADMIENNYFAHYGPDGKKPWDWIDYTTYSYSIAGENLAKDFITAGAVHRALMSSSTHKKNIINPSYQHVGVGIAAGKIDGQNTMVLVQMFGAPLSPLANLKTEGDIKDNLDTVESHLFDKAPTVLSSVEESPGTPKNLAQIQAQNVESSISPTKTRDLFQWVMQYLDYFMFALLGFVVLALLFNVFIQIKIQKPKTILSTMLVIAVILVFMFTNFHFLEGIARVITIR